MGGQCAFEASDIRKSEIFKYFWNVLAYGCCSKYPYSIPLIECHKKKRYSPHDFEDLAKIFRLGPHWFSRMRIYGRVPPQSCGATWTLAHSSIILHYFQSFLWEVCPSSRLADWSLIQDKVLELAKKIHTCANKPHIYCIKSSFVELDPLFHLCTQFLSQSRFIPPGFRSQIRIPIRYKMPFRNFSHHLPKFDQIGVDPAPYKMALL